jgi:hypothetical protein
MFESIIAKIAIVGAMNPFSFATWFVLLTLGFFIWLFAKASTDKKSLVNWEHLIVDSSTDRASPYKLGYIIGIIVSTWIVITFADGGKLSFDILGTYLSFLLGGAGVNILGKKSVPDIPAKVASADEEDPKASQIG